MKTSILVISLLMFATIAQAKTYLLIDSQTKQVVSISPEDDAVVGQGQEKVVVDKEYADIKLEYPVQYYKYTNKKFVEDTKKLSDEENLKQKDAKRAEEEQKINKQMKKMAYEELKASGTKFEIITDDSFK